MTLTLHRRSRRILPALLTCAFALLGQAAVHSQNFGSNVLIFTPSMSPASIQNQINAVFASQQNSQLGTGRYAFFFQPGTYNVNVPVGYYTQVLGLGQTPDGATGTTINGYVDATDTQGAALCNFWREAENLAVNPSSTTCDPSNPCTAPLTSDTDVWAVAQSAPLRRVHIEGNLQLSDYINGYGSLPGASGGVFIGDSEVDDEIDPGSQTESLSRNDSYQSWPYGLWNTVFVGDTNPPTGTFDADGYTVVHTTPVIREKPFLTYSSSTNTYSVFVPSLRPVNSQGPSWTSGSEPGTSISISKFYIAQAGTDTAATINAALASGDDLILTPGIYLLDGPINVTNAGTIVLGLGFATLQPTNGTAAMTVADVSGVDVSGILFDAGTSTSPVSPYLLQLGPRGSSLSHAANPITLHDDFFRVGNDGNDDDTAAECIEINSSNVIADDLWIWRADHDTNGGNDIPWTGDVAANGLVVNGNDVTIYCLECEHFQQYQTLWNGNGGEVYMYESEIPYDIPWESAWMSTWQDVPQDGYPSYKVADSVTSHQAFGLDIAMWFGTSLSLKNAIEVPPYQPGVNFTDSWVGGTDPSAPILNVIDGDDGIVDPSMNWANLLDYYPPALPAVIGTPFQWGDGIGLVPQQVPNLSGETAIACGGGHTLVLQPDGALWAWGFNGSGQLGDGTTTTTASPVRVTPSTGLTNVVAMSAGTDHSMALQSGDVWTWGFNDFGQLGNDSVTNSDVPVQVSGLTNVVAVAGGGAHSLALQSNGDVWAWGYNVYGQIGLPPPTSPGGSLDKLAPVQVSGLPAVTAIAGGYYHSLAIGSDGVVRAWGANWDGQLGNGTTTNSSTPVEADVPVVVTGTVPTTVTSIAAGAYHSLALRSDGTVWAWGYNGDGELGNNSTANSSVPVQVVDFTDPTGFLTGVIAISCGGSHCVALRSDGTVWAWGNGAFGQLGINSPTSSSVPVQVAGGVLGSFLTPVTAIAGGGFFTAALVALNPPSVAIPAAATPSPVTGKSTNLSVLGADATGEGNLTYTWSMTAGPAPVTFSGNTNGTNAAQNITANFTTAGAYTFAVTITDPSGLTTTSSVSVTVTSTAARITVAPANVTLAPYHAKTFTATVYNQFGFTMLTGPSWKVVPQGGVHGSASTVTFIAPAVPGIYTIEAYIGTVVGRATVTVN
ncbi:MAG: PKD domain-containing protein [Capsulimonadaceae bacterium]